MKRNLICLILVLFACNLYGQSVKGFHFQTAVRNLSGHLIVEKTIGVKASIIDSADSKIIYSELFTQNVGYSGQLDLNIGKGNTIAGSFDSINWGQGKYLLQISLDLNGGSNYTIVNTHPFTSVPYALWSKTMEGVVSKKAVKRDLIPNPKIGQVIFCSDCGDGEFQVFNGVEWVNAIGSPKTKGPVLVQQLFIELADPFNYNRQLIDGSLPLKAIALPDSAADKTVVWSIEETNIASIDQDGVLVVNDTGSVTIIATAHDCGGASTSVTYRFIPEPIDPINVVDLTILGDTSTFIGQTKMHLARLDTIGFLDTAIWTSLDTSIASVDTLGSVTGKKVGSTYIVATYSMNSAIKDTIPFHVRAIPIPYNVIYPTITVEGFNGDTQTVFIQRYANIPFPKIFATDDIEDTITYEVQYLDENYNVTTYDSNAMGNFILIVSAEDSFKNKTIDTLSIVIGDREGPKIQIEGGLEVGDTLVSSNLNSLLFPSAIALDEDGDTLQVQINAINYSPGNVGHFFLEYYAIDSNNNATRDTLILSIYDSLAPIISFVDTTRSGDTLQVSQGIRYDLPKAIATDNGKDTIDVEIYTGGFDTLTIGCYKIDYAAIDSFGNADTLSIYAKVNDNTPPEILNPTDFTRIIKSIERDTFKIGKVMAVDNVGIASYSLRWLPINENYSGYIAINDSGEIFISDPGGDVFNADYYYRIYVTDSSGLQDSTTLVLVQGKGSLRDIRAKQHKEASWVGLGRAYGSPDDYEDKVSLSYNIGDTLLFMTASDFKENSFDTLRFDSINPGAGSSDFDLVNSNGIYYLKLKNNFDTSVRKEYNLLFQFYTTSSITNIQSKIPLEVKLTVQSLRESNPELNNLIPPTVNTDTLKVKDILLSSGGGSNYACPLAFANGIMGDLADVMDAVVTALPIIPDSTKPFIAKSLMNKLPAYFWLRKDNGKIRLNMKIPVKGKTVEIEYVSASSNGKECYWVVLLDKLKPSKVSSRLSSLDNDTRAGIVVTTTAITEKDFECIKIPCLDVKAGAHVVAFGKPLTPSITGGFGSAMVDPTAFAVVSPLTSGFSDPNLKLTMGLKADFQTEFNKELVKRMDLNSAAAQAAIKAAEKGVIAAQNAANSAVSKLTGDKIRLNQIIKIYDYYNNLLQHQKTVAATARATFDVAANTLKGILTDDEICTPGVCLVPCLYMGRCCVWKACVPCPRGCGCEVRAPQICVPNPVALALAETFGKETMQGATRALDNATNYLNWIQSNVNHYANLKNAQEAIIAASEKAVETAQAGISTAQSALAQVHINTGDLGKVADYILKHALNKAVTTSKFTFVTTVASVNNGTLTGTLSFDATLLGVTNVSVTSPNFTLNGNNMEAAVKAVVNQLIDLIP